MIDRIQDLIRGLPLTIRVLLIGWFISLIGIPFTGGVSISGLVITPALAIAVAFGYTK